MAVTMVKGLRDLTVFPLTSTNEQGVPTYGQAVKVPSIVSFGIEVQKSEAKAYGDDVLAASSSDITGINVKLELNGLSVAQRALLLGGKLDKNGGYLVKPDDTPPSFGVAFRAPMTNGKYRYVVLYDIQFSQPSDEYKTKGESTEFRANSLDGVAKTREDLRAFSYVMDEDETKAATQKAVLSAWFTTPQVAPTA